MTNTATAEEQAVATTEQKGKITEPRFRDPATMTQEELTDPDYRLKRLMEGNGEHPAVCSKCHHCR